jgi:hypothetical protein
MQSILSVSIDSFCRNYEIYPTAIKIDVDGIEELIVKGMANLILQDDRLKSILIELNLDSSKFITAFLINSGFSVVEHNINGNVLFVRI